MAEEAKETQETKQKESKPEAAKKKSKQEAAKEETAQQAEAAKEWSKEIKQLGDKIVGLTLMQAKELGDYLKEEYGIEPVSGAVMVAGLAGGEAGGGEAAEEKSSFDVILKEIGEKKI
ncbi:MAG: hypothetical protein ACYSSI_14355, partial [Planctomycetota bacterium]